MGKIDFEQGKLYFVVYFLFSFNLFLFKKDILPFWTHFLKPKLLKLPLLFVNLSLKCRFFNVSTQNAT